MEAIVPSCLVNRHCRLSFSAQREINGNGEIKALYERHSEIQEKYAPGKCPLVGENPAEQVKINRDIRDAIHSHVSTWFWNCGGITQHMRSLHIDDVHEVMNMMHDAAMQIRNSEGMAYQETSVNEELLELT